MTFKLQHIAENGFNKDVNKEIMGSSSNFRSLILLYNRKTSPKLLINRNRSN